MNIKKKTVVAGLFILTVIWLGNILYLKQHQFSEPMIMKHYYDLELLGDEGSFDIYYLVNRNDKLDIASIEIPEGTLMTIFPSQHASYQNYEMRKATVKLDKTYLKDLLKSNQTVITDVFVQFTDGSSQKVNIGKINILLDNKQKPLQLTISSGGSNDNTGFDEFQTEQPMKITGLEYMFSDMMNDILKFYINDQPVHQAMFPLSFDANETISIKHAYVFEKKNDPRKFNFYQLRVLLPVEARDYEGAYLYSLVHYTPSNVSAEDLQRYIDERGVH